MSNLHVALSPTRYIVPLNGVIHRVRRDGICTCGGTPAQPCATTPCVWEYLAGGGRRPPGHPESAWPDEWAVCCTVS